MDYARTISLPLTRLATLPAAIVCASLLALAAVAPAATDPDIDPAQPIEVFIEDGEGPLAITSVQGYLQVTAEGLPYLRLDYEVTNLGDEAIRGHRWQLLLGDAEARAVVGGLIEPGASARHSFLGFGSEVEGVQGTDTGNGVTLKLSGSTSTSTRTDRDCALALTQKQCEAHARATQAVCNGKKVGSGCDAGVMVCREFCFTDKYGQRCCSVDPSCECLGRTPARTLSETIFEQTAPSADPLIDPVFHEGRRLEMRPNLPEGF